MEIRRVTKLTTLSTKISDLLEEGKTKRQEKLRERKHYGSLFGTTSITWKKRKTNGSLFEKTLSFQMSKISKSEKRGIWANIMIILTSLTVMCWAFSVFCLFVCLLFGRKWLLYANEKQHILTDVNGYIERRKKQTCIAKPNAKTVCLTFSSFEKKIKINPPCSM